MHTKSMRYNTMHDSMQYMSLATTCMGHSKVALLESGALCADWKEVIVLCFLLVGCSADIHMNVDDTLGVS